MVRWGFALKSGSENLSFLFLTSRPQGFFINFLGDLMQLQKFPQAMPRRFTPRSTGPQNPEGPPPGGENHHHGLAGALLHIGHDAAMLAMAVPSTHLHQQPLLVEICSSEGIKQIALDDIVRSTNPPTDHSAHGETGGTHHFQSGHGSHGHPGPSLEPGTNWLHLGSAAVSGLVAVGAAVHGVQMMTSKDRLSQLEGANHLLMSASSGVMAAGMLLPQTGLGIYSAPLMAAHGLGGVALGAYQIVRGIKENCSHDRWGGLMKLAHGGCLSAAQFFPGAALPLYLGMAAATVGQVALQQFDSSH